MAELPSFTMLGTRAAPDQYSFPTSAEVQRVLCDCLGDGCSRFSRSEDSVHLVGQGTVPHSREALFGSQSPVL